MFGPEITIREERNTSFGVVDLGGVAESAYRGVTLSDEFLDGAFRRVNNIARAGSLVIVPPIETAPQPSAEAEDLSLAAA